MKRPQYVDTCPSKGGVEDDEVVSANITEEKVEVARATTAAADDEVD